MLPLLLLVAPAEPGHHSMSHGRRLKAEWPGEPTWQARAVWAERISPTTDSVSFTPRTWPIQRHPWDEPMYKLAFLQRACVMTNNDPASCYTNSAGTSPFTFADSDTTNKKYELYRRAKDPNDPESYTPAGLRCNEELTSADETFYIGWGASFATADYTNPSDCEWETNDPGYFKRIADKVGPADTPYDYTFEVCARGGACEATDFNCINAYTVVALADPLATDARTLFAYDISKNNPPPDGRGQDDVRWRLGPSGGVEG